VLAATANRTLVSREAGSRQERDRKPSSRYPAASWDDLSGKCGIATQGKDLRELQEMIQDATLRYFRFPGVKAPNTARLHFADDLPFALA